jgi:hypothetical protein
MPVKHVVELGEHLPGIAAKHGFRDWQTVWNAPENEELRKIRLVPAVLLPGDVITIPNRSPKTIPGPTNKLHQFEVSRRPIKLRLRLQDPLGNIMAGVPCQLLIEDEIFDLTADGDGIVEQEVRPDITFAQLLVDGFEFELDVGALDPATATTGIEARLVNLSHFAGFVGDDDPDELKFAVELFEAEQGLSVTGESQAIAEPLVEEHGA